MTAVEIPVRVKLEPQKLIQIIGGLADAIDKGEMVIASHLNSIVLRYLPEKLRGPWLLSFDAARNHEIRLDHTFAALMTHRKFADADTMTRCKRRAVGTLLAHSVDLEQVVDESSKDRDLFLR